MSTTLVIAGAVILGLAVWKGRKILVSKADNGDYQLEISKLKTKLDTLKKDMYKLNTEKAALEYKNAEVLKHITTKGMNMKKLRGIVKKDA